MAAMAGLMAISFWHLHVEKVRSFVFLSKRSLQLTSSRLATLVASMGKRTSSASAASALFDEDEGKDDEVPEDVKRRRTDIVQCECCGAKPEDQLDNDSTSAFLHCVGI
eukprot:5550319-Amphidinium_carterae.3